MAGASFAAPVVRRRLLQRGVREGRGCCPTGRQPPLAAPQQPHRSHRPARHSPCPAFYCFGKVLGSLLHCRGPRPSRGQPVGGVQRLARQSVCALGERILLRQMVCVGTGGCLVPVCVSAAPPTAHPPPHAAPSLVFSCVCCSPIGPLCCSPRRATTTPFGCGRPTAARAVARCSTLTRWRKGGGPRGGSLFPHLLQ